MCVDNLKQLYRHGSIMVESCETTDTWPEAEYGEFCNKNLQHFRLL